MVEAALKDNDLSQEHGGVHKDVEAPDVFDLELAHKLTVEDEEQCSEYLRIHQALTAGQRQQDFYGTHHCIDYPDSILEAQILLP